MSMAGPVAGKPAARTTGSIAPRTYRNPIVSNSCANARKRRVTEPWIRPQDAAAPSGWRDCDQAEIHLAACRCRIIPELVRLGAHSAGTIGCDVLCCDLDPWILQRRNCTRGARARRQACAIRGGPWIAECGQVIRTRAPGSLEDHLHARPNVSVPHLLGPQRGSGALLLGNDANVAPRPSLVAQVPMLEPRPVPPRPARLFPHCLRLLAHPGPAASSLRLALERVAASRRRSAPPYCLMYEPLHRALSRVPTGRNRS